MVSNRAIVPGALYKFGLLVYGIVGGYPMLSDHVGSSLPTSGWPLLKIRNDLRSGRPIEWLRW